MRPSLIRPGLLVSLKTTIRGGITYEKRIIDPEHKREGDEATVATWETTREIKDAAEHRRAIEARGKASVAIRRVCCKSSFGLLCPTDRESQLADAIEEAQTIADEHNKRAKFTRLDVYVISGRIADNDEQATRAIAAEVNELITSMERAVRAADPEAIRDAARRAREVSGMLGESAKLKVSAAIAEVRKIATDIVKRVEKSGERAADVVKDVKLEALKGARFAVLDLDSDASDEDTSLPIAGRSVDLLEPLSSTPVVAAAPAAIIEL